MDTILQLIASKGERKGGHIIGALHLDIIEYTEHTHNELGSLFSVST